MVAQSVLAGPQSMRILSVREHVAPELLPSFAVLELKPKYNRGHGNVGQSESENKQFRAGLTPTVLMFGYQRELALYRADVLKRAGFEVLIPATNEEARDVVESGAFHAAVLSYTLSSEIVKEFADLIRQKCPECPLSPSPGVPGRT